MSLDRFADVKCSIVVDWKALKHPQIYDVMVSFSVDKNDNILERNLERRRG